MNKKTAMALVVGAAFATPVLAQTTGSTLEIYGRLYPQVNSSKGKGASAPADVGTTFLSGAGTTNGNHDRRVSVDTSNSRVGFRGQEQLGGGLAAIWQIEQRVRIDEGSGIFAGDRDSFLGLRGGFGTLKLGNMDTVYKTYGAAVGNFFGVGSGNFVSSSNFLSEHGVGVEDSEFGDTGFHIRAPNSIQYETPEFGGFQAGLQFSPDERKGNPTRGNLNTNLWSAAVKYEAGPLYASVQYERHNDWFDVSTSVEDATGVATSATNSKDTATRLSGKFAITPNHRVTGDIAQMEWKETGGVAGDFEKFKKRTWAVGWEAKWGGPWATEITYTRANKGTCSVVGGGCTTDGMEGSLVAVGVGYTLSKRTLIFGIANKAKNGNSSQFDASSAFTPDRGEDVTNLAIGVSHSF
jgi:predicted porin